MNSLLGSRVSKWAVAVAAALVLFLLYPKTRLFFVDYGIRWLYILSLSGLLCFCLTPVFGFLAARWGVLDRPDKRKLHLEATPLLGGAAIFCGFVLAIMINGIYSKQIIVVLVSSALVFGISTLDDVRKVSASIKLVVQVLSAALVILYGMVLTVIPDGLGLFAKLGNVILTLFWIVGITNAINFLDGMDGVAAGLGAIISFFLGALSFLTFQPFLGWCALAIMGGCLGFLPYNLNINKPASIFLGDAGSTFIGYVMACLAVYGNWCEDNPVVSFSSPLLIFWIPIADMVYITIDRILSSKVTDFRSWIEYVGHDHLHHRLFYVLGGKMKTVIVIYLFSITLGLGALVIRNKSTSDAFLVLAQAVLIVILGTVLERHGRRLARARERGWKKTGHSS